MKKVLPTVSSTSIYLRHYKRPNDTKEATCSLSEDTSMILETGCTKAMCSRTALQNMKAGLHSQNIEILPDTSTFKFANGQQALAKEKYRIWLLESPPCPCSAWPDRWAAMAGPHCLGFVRPCHSSIVSEYLNQLVLPSYPRGTSVVTG